MHQGRHTGTIGNVPVRADDGQSLYNGLMIRTATAQNHRLDQRGPVQIVEERLINASASPYRSDFNVT